MTNVEKLIEIIEDNDLLLEELKTIIKMPMRNIEDELIVFCHKVAYGKGFVSKDIINAISILKEKYS